MKVLWEQDAVKSLEFANGFMAVHCTAQVALVPLVAQCRKACAIFRRFRFGMLMDISKY